MAVLTYVYTGGLEALYIDGTLHIVDEIIDTERALKFIKSYKIDDVKVYRIEDDIFELRYDYEFPFLLNRIFDHDLIGMEKTYGKVEGLN